MKYCINKRESYFKNQVVDANVYVENTKITEISLIVNLMMKQ